MFVNFISPEWALRAFLLLSGKSWSFKQSHKVCRIAGSLLQGLGLNLANHVINSGIWAGNPNGPVVFTCDGQKMELQLAVKTFCTPEDFYTAQMHAAAAPSMKVSETIEDVDSRLHKEMLTMNVNSKLQYETLTKGKEDEQVATHGLDSSNSSSCSFSMQKTDLQDIQHALQTSVTPYVKLSGSTTSGSIESPQSLYGEESNYEGTSASSSLNMRDYEQSPHNCGRDVAPDTASSDSIGSSMQRTANPTHTYRTWYVASHYLRSSAQLDTHSKKLLDSIQFYAVSF